MNPVPCFPKSALRWPASLRDATHPVALKGCRAALRREIEAETARALSSHRYVAALV
ncbi:DUF982 domain-containing protein [Rhizobium leguminosarum]|nr:DUF982 domain-containing protein [Rhizobium leguminosarum]